MFDVEMRHDLLIRIAVRQHRSLVASSGEAVVSEKNQIDG
jgi:hypothetical protein